MRLRARLSYSRTIDGIEILALDDEVLDRVGDALVLVEKHDPLRYRRLLADVDRIWVERSTEADGWFERASWTIWLNQFFVLDETTKLEDIAVMIVHEATHARLSRIGIGYDETIRRRVEEVCLRRERAFAARVPGGVEGLWQDEDFDRLPDYSNAAAWRRHDETQIADLRMLGTPDWMVAALLKLRALRHRRR